MLFRSQVVEDSVRLEAKLNQLDHILGDEANKSSQGPAWRPTPSALQNQAAHDRQTVKAAKEALQREVLAPLQHEVAQLEQNISDLRFAFINLIAFTS